jgi:hypothetical protein
MEPERSGKGVVIAFVGAAVLLIAVFEVLLRVERSAEPVRPNIEQVRPAEAHRSEETGPDLRTAVLKSAPASEPSAVKDASSEVIRVAPDAAAPAEVHASIDAGVPFGTDQAGIRAAMQAAIPDIRECYDAWGKATPGTEGRLAIHLVIASQSDGGAPEGRVSEISVGDGQNAHHPIESCVLQVLSELHFAAPGAPVQVDYPITFKTVEPRF